MSGLLSKALKKRKAIQLSFEGVMDKPTYDGTNTVFTFTLSDPISMTGSTTYTDINTGNIIPTSVEDAVIIHIMEDDLNKFADEFQVEKDANGNIEKVVGYSGEGLLLDVSRPKYNTLNGKVRQPAALWLRPHKFSETPRIIPGRNNNASMKQDTGE